MLGYDRYRESETVTTGESTMAQQMIIGIDLAKHVFQVCMVTPKARSKRTPPWRGESCWP
jgi:hypothetical protein